MLQFKTTYKAILGRVVLRPYSVGKRGIPNPNSVSVGLVIFAWHCILSNLAKQAEWGLSRQQEKREKGLCQWWEVDRTYIKASCEYATLSWNFINEPKLAELQVLFLRHIYQFQQQQQQQLWQFLDLSWHRRRKNTTDASGPEGAQTFKSIQLQQKFSSIFTDPLFLHFSL